jgi:predicted kinase
MAKKVKGVKSKPKPRLEFLVLIGPPCCGKTTFTKQPKYKDYLVASIDDEIMAQNPTLLYHEAYQACNWKEAEKAFKARFLSEVQKKEKSIIIDKTNLGSKSRKRLLATVPPEYVKIAMIFNWDVKELKRRSKQRAITEKKFVSDKVIDFILDQFVPIQTDEGFDKVIQVR